MGVLPQIWWSTGIQISRTYLGNVLFSSWKLNRIPQKCIQKLVDVCGRASLSRNSLFGYVFIDLKPVENSASLSEGLRQPSHYSWIGRRQCCLGYPPYGQNPQSSIWSSPLKLPLFCSLQSRTDANSYQELWNLWNVNEYESADEKAPRFKPTPTNLSRVVENCPHIRFGGLEHFFVQMQLREVQETVVPLRETPLKKSAPSIWAFPK